MAMQTRRGFIKLTTLGTAMLTSVPTLATAACSTDVAATDSSSNTTTAPVLQLSPDDLKNPVVAYVRNFDTGEIGLLVGSREIVYRDSEFVKRLLSAAN